MARQNPEITHKLTNLFIEFLLCGGPALIVGKPWQITKFNCESQ